MRDAINLKRLALAAASLSLAATAGAQLPSASPAALGMGDNYTAMARGFGAVSWNPANLGLSHNPRFSLTFLGLTGGGDLGPITLADVAQYQGISLPNGARDAWMDRVDRSGGEEGLANGGVTLFGMSSGHFAAQLATTANVDANLAPGAMELLLYGNAGRTGTARDIDLSGARLTGAVVTTGALAWAYPIDLGLARLSVGATAKYTMGNTLLHAQDGGTRMSANGNVDVNFPIILSDTAASTGMANRGHGFGLDLGAAWQSGPVTAGLALQNVMNTFKWDASQFFYRPIQSHYGSDTTYSRSDVTLPLDSAPAAVRDWLADQRFKPMISAGVAIRMTPTLTLSADLRRELGTGLRVGDRTHAGIGAELRVIPFVPLRAGFAVRPEGIALSGGTGLELGPVNITLSAQDRRSSSGHAPGAAIGISFGGR